MTTALCENPLMTNEQEAALQRVKESKARLDQLKQEERELQERIRRTRLEVGEDIADARAVKVTQALLVEELGEQRETLRRWEDAAKKAGEGR